MTSIWRAFADSSGSFWRDMLGSFWGLFGVFVFPRGKNIEINCDLKFARGDLRFRAGSARHFGVSVLGSFWGHFGVIFGSFWGHFGIIFWSFGGLVGVILGSFSMPPNC